jgi:GGDEF domain-containing protein
MNRLRLWITLLILWLIFFFNIERINSPINIRSYTYIFVAIVVAVTLALPRLQRISFLFLITIPVPIFLWLKATIEKGTWYDNLLNGYSLPLTVTQVSAIILTGLLARQILYGLREFEDVIAHITFGYIGKPPKPFAEGQSAMYKEVKRARRYHRPLSVIALRINEADVQVAIPQITKDIQQAMIHEYVMAGVARTLDENMHDFDTIAVHNNHFILVLPELSNEEVKRLAAQLVDTVKDKMKVRLQAGTASFPDEAVTFENLVEAAMGNIEQPIEIYIPKTISTGPNLGEVRL